jgi:3-methyladenine DNA glycosylase AlkD
VSANPVVAEIHDGLHRAADPGLAPAMAAYMKVEQNGSLPFLGVRRPAVRKLARDTARAHPDPAGLLDAARTLWDGGTSHEERYASQDLLGLPWARGRLDLLDLHRHQVVTGAWWDHVDETAHRIEDLLVTHPASVDPVLRAWSTDDDRWLRRVSIISQLGRREETDLDLLAAVIEPNLAEQDFFVRKAIGWALRQQARTSPHWVREFVETHELSTLSRREALKHL